MIKNRLVLFVIFSFISSLFTHQVSAQVVSTIPATKVYSVRAKLTSYCTCRICCGRFSGKNKTATGTDARKPNGVAAAPQLVPFGSRVYIPGLRVNQYRNVDDTGGGMRRMARRGVVQFDVRASSHAEAKRFGTRYQDVLVILDDPTKAQCDFFDAKSLAWWETNFTEPVLAFEDAVQRLMNPTAATAPELVSLLK